MSQREIGTDAESFEVALRAALREDPDVILVGEMRDLESIAATLTLAETGHLVFATLHTNDTGAVTRPHRRRVPGRSPRPDPGAALGHLRGVIYQRLIPRIGGGLVGAYEIMVGNNAVKNLVREGKTRQLRNVVSTASRRRHADARGAALRADRRRASSREEAALERELAPARDRRSPRTGTCAQPRRHRAAHRALRK